MARTTHFMFSIFFVIQLIVLGACAGAKKEAGYYKTKQLISRDSTDKLKSGIRGISNDIFKPFQYTGNDKTAINYRLLSPENINNKDKYPLVLILHGSGSVGTDNISQLGVLPKLWAQSGIREKYPAFVVAPQFPRRSSNYVPDPQKKVLASVPDPCLTTALQLIDSLKRVLPVDERKIYVIGFSMGASSTVNSLILRPDLFAAGIAISGIPEFNTSVLSKISLWIIHGNADTENPMASDSLLYKELESANSPSLRFWEIDNLEHDIYYRLYASDIIPRWLFRQKKK